MYTEQQENRGKKRDQSQSWLEQILKEKLVSGIVDINKPSIIINYYATF